MYIPNIKFCFRLQIYKNNFIFTTFWFFFLINFAKTFAKDLAFSDGKIIT